MSKRRRTVVLLLIGAWVIGAIMEVTIGPVRIPISRILPASLAYISGSHLPDAVVMGNIRLPRMVVALFVGAGLGASGAVLQAVFRNSMADPGIIGVSSGGSLGAVILMATGGVDLFAWMLPLGAFIASLATVFVIFRLGTVKGRTSVHSLLLSGVAISALFSSIVTLILSVSDQYNMKRMLFWLMGGLEGKEWPDALSVSIPVLAGICIYLYYAADLDIISIGEDQAESVGVSLQRLKQVLLAACALVVGTCVSVSGVIGFVGLIVPHLIRIWIGPQHKPLILASAVGGAALLTLADVAAKTLAAPIELNIGILTSCLGAPFFLYLLRKQYIAEQGEG